MVLSNWKSLIKTLFNNSEQLLLALMKIRLGLLHEDPAFCFEVAKLAASSIFKWIRSLAQVFENFINIAPEKVFRRICAKFLKENWNNVTLTDCSEIFHRAFNARPLIFPQYKNHGTVKYILACTPSG